MSLIPCEHKIGCESDYPLTNYSAEDPDPRTFLGYSTGTAPTSSFPRNTGGGGPRDGGPDRDDTGDGPGDTAQTGTGGAPPPLGSEWDNAVITTFAESEESQAQAHDDAGNDNVSMLAASSDTGQDAGGWLLPPNRTRPAVFGNDPQTCSVPCADGTMFTVTVPANRIRQFSKAKANAAALSQACKLAQFDKLCLSSIDGNVCVGSEFDQTIIADTANVPVTFIVSGGTFPDWVDAVVDDIEGRVRLTGTPEAGDIGSNTFTITAIDAVGIFISKEYNISVTSCECEITTSTLDKFDQGQPYSFQLVSTAIDPQTWTLLNGSLPDGLSLSSTGLISGTAALTNGNLDKTFTVLCTGDDGGTCSKDLTLEVIDYHNFPPGKKYRIKSYVVGGYWDSGCPTCGGPAVPTVDWNGNFDNQQASALFRSDDAIAPGSVTVLSVYAVYPRIGLGIINSDLTGGSPAWQITLECPYFTGITVTSIWQGMKVGSNNGSKLDSPAGIYTFVSSPGFPYVTLCASNATVEIEEY